jgi:Fibronectin type III domain
MAGSEWQDSGQAPAALAQVLAEHGSAGLSNAQIMAGMLKDLMPNAPRETNVLVQAAEVGLAQTLQDRLSQGLAPDAAVAMAARTLQEQTGLGQDASLWAAATIGSAMGLLPSRQPGQTAELPDPAGVQAPAGRPDDNTVYGQAQAQPDTADTRTTFAQPANPAGQYQQGQDPQAQQAGYPQAQQAGFAPGQQAQYPQQQQLYPQPQYQAPQPGYQPGQGYGGYQPRQGGYPAGQPVQPYPPGTLPPAGSGSRGKTGMIIGVAAAAVVLLIGLVVWAPWSSSSVQSPTNLHTAAAATANTVTLAWSAPSGGPAPSKYEIVENGRDIGSVASTHTTERIIDLSPATSYHYEIIAVSGAKTSQPSAALTATTLTPPLSAARLQSSYTTNFDVLKADPKDYLFHNVGKQWTNTWTFTPDCSAGACKSIGLTGKIMKFGFSTTLSWDGKLYYGTTAPVLGYCANNTAYPIHYQLRIGVKVTAAAPSGTNWAATKWTGVILGVLPYTPAGSTYCARHSFESGLKGFSS